jgi:hypothetical protein
MLHVDDREHITPCAALNETSTTLLKQRAGILVCGFVVVCEEPDALEIPHFGTVRGLVWSDLNGVFDIRESAAGKKNVGVRHGSAAVDVEEDVEGTGMVVGARLGA